MTKIKVIDPGMSSGAVLVEYHETTPFKILGQWQLMDGGVPQLRAHMDSQEVPDLVVCEKFSPLPRVFKLRELEPLRAEGYIEHGFCAQHGIPVVWQTPGSLNIAGSNHGSYAKNHNAANAKLKALGLWRTGMRDFGTKDANDANAAMKHLIAYFRSIGHGPSLEVINSV